MYPCSRGPLQSSVVFFYLPRVIDIYNAPIYCNFCLPIDCLLVFLQLLVFLSMVPPDIVSNKQVLV